MINKILGFIYHSLNRYYFFSKLFTHLFNIREAIELHKLRGSVSKSQLDEFYKRILQLKNYEGSLYFLLRGSAGDYCLYFCLLDSVFKYLEGKKNKVVLVCTDKYKDVVKLIQKKYTYLSFVFLETNETETITEEIFRDLLSLPSDTKIVDLRNLYKVCENEFIFTRSNGHYKTVLDMDKMLKNDFEVNSPEATNNEYLFDNVDYNKIKHLENNYSNNGKLIICNMENKSFKGATRDFIPFIKYLNFFINLADVINYRFIINSVYDEGKFFENKSVIVTKLNFQEIIYLCEHHIVGLFISERNGLNDVFKIFYPEINQIIYYPDCYNLCVDKNCYYKLFHEIIKKGDVKDFWHIPGNNIIEDIRGNFFKTIDNYIKIFANSLLITKQF